MGDIVRTAERETLFSIGEDGKIRGRALDGTRRFASQKAHLGGAIAIARLEQDRRDRERLERAREEFGAAG